jgi:hypothetical protein
MKNTQAWGWLAAGVLALGLNGVYHDCGAAWAHRTVGRFISRIEEHSVPVLALAAGRADWLMAKTETETAAVRDQTVSCPVASSVARWKASLLQRSLLQNMGARTQARMARFEEMSGRQEAALARLEAERARIEARAARVRFAPAAFNPAVCPRVRMNIPRVKISVPEMPLEVLGAGPI